MIHTIESQIAKIATKERILDAAEGLIAENGFTATSLRQITAKAEVNLAAVNYHFHSKDALALAVLMRKIGPINEDRLARLDAVESSTSGQLPLEPVIDCLIRPVFEARQRQTFNLFPQFMARIFLEPGAWVQSITKPAFGPLMERFQAAIARALPGADPAILGWGLFFGIGSFVHTLAKADWLALFQVPAAQGSDDVITADHLVRYIAAGIRCLAQQASGQGEGRS